MEASSLLVGVLFKLFFILGLVAFLSKHRRGAGILLIIAVAIQFLYIFLSLWIVGYHEFVNYQSPSALLPSPFANSTQTIGNVIGLFLPTILLLGLALISFRKYTIGIALVIGALLPYLVEMVKGVLSNDLDLLAIFFICMSGLFAWWLWRS